MRTFIPSRTFRLALSLVLALGGVSLTITAAYGDAAPVEPGQDLTIHPTFALLDREGVNVRDSGQPISTLQTCGQCHNTDFISSHSFHAAAGLNEFTDPGALEGARPWDTSNGVFGKWNPLAYRYLSPEGDERIDLTTAGWLMLYGSRHVGGGPAQFSRSGVALTSLGTNASNPETAILNERTGTLRAWDWEQSGIEEMNCFLCHLDKPDSASRDTALQAGRFAWANTATLAATSIVEPSGTSFTYNPEAFQDDGTLVEGLLTPQDPLAENCGLCHGQVASDLSSPVTLNTDLTSDWRTFTTGQILSGQRVVNSGLNLKDKATITRTWDIHMERGLECVDCHYSLNNPVFTQRDAAEQPDHLIFDPRRLELSDYLYQPLHEFARGESTQSAVAPELWNTMRRCDSCHDATASHTWLPYADRHTDALACETCHAPQMYAPAIQSRDWTVLTAAAEPLTEYRGVEGDPADPASLITGYEPVILQRQTVDGDSALAPYNLVTSWYWVYSEPARPVRLLDLQAAWLENGRHPQQILDVFDADGDGQLSEVELRLDTDAKTALITARLQSLGLNDPRIVAEVQPYSINHNITNGDWATRECQSCHSQDSALTATTQLAGYIPGGVLPEFVPGANTSITGTIAAAEDGSLAFVPAPDQDGLYILGRHSVTWVDWFGVLALLGTVGAVSTHAALRVIAARRQPHAAPATRRVYMYSVYERFWHWLQTFTILILLVTGLIIHKPDMLGALWFNGVVIIHNVLAALLVLNAALSLFYHLVSGEIRQYIPRPYGFFDQAVEQALFYIRGIFRGDPHPFEKTPANKLNPLQKVTYFGILNVLLPLQIVTGALMWGAQRWPELAQRLGGLPFLGPFHTLIAWTFAAFIIAHVYLTTTGHEPLAGIKGMILGWDEVEAHTER
ncbi:MAG: hypothetical protein EPO32_14000 [Anaerolineae bacterium]|nr:MAG: hypothetical protein EPO32_14000 [Anaerolineae bacterium]